MDEENTTPWGWLAVGAVAVGAVGYLLLRDPKPTSTGLAVASPKSSSSDSSGAQAASGFKGLEVYVTKADEGWLVEASSFAGRDTRGFMYDEKSSQQSETFSTRAKAMKAAQKIASRARRTKRFTAVRVISTSAQWKAYDARARRSNYA